MKAMSVIWVGMLLCAVAFALWSGTEAQTGAAALEGAGKGVTLAVSLAGPLCLWSGFGEVLTEGGGGRLLANCLRPVLGRLFPSASKDAEAMAALSGNVTANLLGLGSAATPLGVRAAQRLQALSGTRTAGDETCLLIVMNTASIQLLPSTVAALRSGLGAKAPFDILPAVWVTSICSVAAGLLAARGLRRLWR